MDRNKINKLLDGIESVDKHDSYLLNNGDQEHIYTKISNDISVTVSEDNSLTSFHAVADPIIKVDENEPNFFKKILNWFINSPVKPYAKKRNFNDQGNNDTFLDDKKSVNGYEIGIKIDF